LRSCARCWPASGREARPRALAEGACCALGRAGAAGRLHGEQAAPSARRAPPGGVSHHEPHLSVAEGLAGWPVPWLRKRPEVQ
jgi:hypothetical protein